MSLCYSSYHHNILLAGGAGEFAGSSIYLSYYVDSFSVVY